MIARDSRIRLSELDDLLDGDNEFAEAALRALKQQRPLDTHTAATAGKALIQHWLGERELKCYAHGREIDYFTEAGKDTVFPDENGDYGLALMAVEHDRIIDRVELEALIHTWKMPMPIRLKNEAPPAPEQAKSATKEVSAVTWQEEARKIADKFFDRDTANKCRDSLAGYASRVMDEMQKLKIHGPRGRIDNPGTVQRDALQGAKWWATKKP